MAHSLFLKHTQPEDFITLAVHLKRFARAERILGCERHLLLFLSGLVQNTIIAHSDIPCSLRWAAGDIRSRNWPLRGIIESYLLRLPYENARYKAVARGSSFNLFSL